jgi:predicted aspartyl protease
MSEKTKQLIGTYHETNHPFIQIEVDFGDSRKILNGLIDTGCTYTILSKKIASEYIDDIESLEHFEFTGANGKSIQYKLKDRHLIRICDIVEADKGFKMELYTTEIGSEDYEIDMILGLSFLKECKSFWLDARSCSFILEFF